MDVISSNLERAAESLLRRLKALGATLALAESCTGGLCSAALTACPGASEVFVGGYVVYSNEAKVRDLNVSPQVLEKWGAVSAETVEQLLQGLLTQTAATIVGAVSGIAGPGGGSVEKPVGTVFVGVATTEKVEVKGFWFEGDRTQIREQTALTLFKMLKERLS